MTSVFCWQTSVSLCPASFSTLRPNLPITSGISWPTFCIPVPYDEKDTFAVLVLEGLVVHRIIQLQVLQHSWFRHRLGLLWYWMICLGNEQILFCHFWDCPQVLHFCSFVDYEGYSISSKRFLPTVVDIMIIWIKFTHSSLF